MKTIVTRYWFEFDSNQSNNLPLGLSIGCGITAFDYEDAFSILKQKVFKGQEISGIKGQKGKYRHKDFGPRTCHPKHERPDIERRLVSNGIRVTSTPYNKMYVPLRACGVNS